jgi:hypothetical protein
MPRNPHTRPCLDTRSNPDPRLAQKDREVASLIQKKPKPWALDVEWPWGPQPAFDFSNGYSDYKAIDFVMQRVHRIDAPRVVLPEVKAFK